jgi:hypothetical protein
VCQKQIVVPNNSLLYCSEKCRRADAISSMPPIFHRSVSSITLSDEIQSTPNAKFTSFEPSRKDSWGITASPVLESSPVPIQRDPQLSNSTSGSPTFRLDSLSRSHSRPLPPLRPRPSGSSPRSMDLVWPVYREQLSTPTPSEAKSLESKSFDYGRRIVQGKTANTSGGLKKLFHFKELQADPNT